MGSIFKLVGIGLHAFLTLPLWFTLVASILVHIEAPGWTWGVFVGYCFASAIGTVCASIGIAMDD